MRKSLIDQLWEEGYEHPLAVDIIQAVNSRDTECCVDLRYGGDGDIGQSVLLLLTHALQQLESTGHHELVASFHEAFKSVVDYTDD